MLRARVVRHAIFPMHKLFTNDPRDYPIIIDAKEHRIEVRMWTVPVIGESMGIVTSNEMITTSPVVCVDRDTDLKQRHQRGCV